MEKSMRFSNDATLGSRNLSLARRSETQTHDGLVVRSETMKKKLEL